MRCGFAASVSQEDRARLSSLQQKIDELDHAGKYRDAIPVAEERLKLVEKTGDLDPPETGAACDKLGDLYRKNGAYAKAESVLQRALAIREKTLGPQHPEIAESLNNLALLFCDMYEYAKAEPLHQRAFQIREKALGPEHPKTVESVSNLAALYVYMRQYAKAEPLSERAARVREKVLGSEHPDTADSLHNLGLLYYKMGRFAEAEPLYQRSLAIREKALGPEHPDTARSLDSLAVLSFDASDYAKAEPLYQRVLKIREKTLGPEHPYTARSLSHLALLYEAMGDYTRAEPLHLRTLEIREKMLGPENPYTAQSLANLALLYEEMGDYAKAEPLHQRALEIREKALGPDHPETADNLNNLSGHYFRMGDYAKAELLCQRALKILEKTSGPEHPGTATQLDNLALLYEAQGHYAQAEPLHQRALTIREKALGPEHPDTATSVSGLAGCYDAMGDYAKAESFHQHALKIREKALGPEHPDTATSLENLAILFHKTGAYAKAEPLFRRSLQIREKVIGPDHPDTAKVLNHLALLEIDLGNVKDAIPLLGRVRAAEEKHLSNILSFTSEAQRLEFQKTTNPYSLAAALGSASTLAEIVLRQKGLVLDSLLEDRLVADASSDPKQRAVVEELHSAKERLTKLVMEVPEDFSEMAHQHRDTDKEKLATQIEQLEGGLARQVAGLGRARRALGVTVPQVQSVLPQQSALIELLRYSHYLEKDKYEPCYGAIVISAKGEPGWVPLGGAAAIENNVVLYQKSVRGKTDEATLSTVLRALEEQLWAPIEKALPPGIKTVIVSPDAELSFVSFATLLMPEDRFIGEKYFVRYVASGRDLLKEAKQTPGAKRTMQVFANPDFGGIAADSRLTKVNTGALRSVEMRNLKGISLPRLPGTEKESAKLEARAKKSDWHSQTYLGAEATEAELRQVNSPRILHLATHGFFLPELDLGKPKSAGDAIDVPKGKLVNPMHRSGLAMAGAQRTLEAWAKGEVPPIENDGVITAEEVGGLKLDGTWLVALSACDTGGGEARTGEGVMGLRRGFLQAGAQNLLMTLWPISDETTVQIMLDFYDAAFKSRNAPQALAETQRNWLVKLREKRGLLPSVQLAGAFIMSSQGRQ